MEDRKLVALVLEEPGLRLHLELKAVGRLERVPPAHVALRDAVTQHDQPARLVRGLGACVLRELRAQVGPDHHQTLSSIARSTSAASQKPAERYFQPPSARTQTTMPSSSSSASRRATCTTAPDDTPVNRPSSSSKARTPATDSSF